MLKGDSMLVVQAISADTISLSTLGSLIADAKYFTSCLMNYITLIQREKVIRLPIAKLSMLDMLQTTLCGWSLFLHLLFLLSRLI